MGGGRRDFRAGGRCSPAGTRRPTEEDVWRAAARNGLLLIVVWCLGSMRHEDHRPRRRRDPGLPVLALRQHGAGRLRSGHRGPCDLAAHQPRQRFGVREADLVAVRTCCHAGHLSRRRGRRAGAAVRRIAQFPRAEPGLRKRPRPADHQHLRCGAVSAGPVHLRGGDHHRLPRRPAPATPRRRVPRKRAVPAGAGQRPEPATTASRRTHRPPVGRGDDPHPDRRHPRRQESPTTAMPQLAGSPRIFRGDDSATRQIPTQKPRIFRPPQDSP